MEAVRATAEADGWSEEQLETEINRIKTAWEETITAQEEAIRESEEEIMSSWQDLFDNIKTNYEDLLEELVAKYQKTMSAGYGDQSLFEDAYERKKELDEEYLEDYEKLYELSKLTRSISTSMDETDNIKGKERLRALQAEINKLSAEGVKLSQYDVDVLQRKYELELARQELEDAKNGGSLVRLQRDQEGNWGYVYTADEDLVAEKEQAYEDKLYEYQKLNAEYIDTLEEKILEVQTDYAEKLQEIMSLNLTDEERQKAITELKQDTEEKLRIIEESYEKVFGNQSGTLGLMEQLYKVTGPELVDNWQETVLGMMSKTKDFNSYFEEMANNIKELTSEMIEAWKEYQNQMQDAYGVVDSSIKTPEDLANFLKLNTETIKNLSTEAVDETKNLADEMANIFENALKSLTDFQKDWLDGLTDIFDMEEEFKAIQKLLDYLAINAVEDLVDKKEAELEELKNRLVDGSNLSKQEELAIRNQIALLTEQLEKLHNEIADYYADNATSTIDGTSFDTGGYTGEWGPDGRLAWLHQKELILNPQDTENFLDAIKLVKTIELNSFSLLNELGNLIPSAYTMEREALQQEVYITAEFPNAVDHTEIEEAFNNLLNDATQYAFSRE